MFLLNYSGKTPYVATFVMNILMLHWMTLLSVFLQRDLVNRFGPARICQDRSGRDGLWSSLPAASVPESWRRPAHEQHAKDQGGTPERQRNHRKETVKETVPCTASTCLHAILLKAKRSCVSPKQWSLPPGMEEQTVVPLWPTCIGFRVGGCRILEISNT